MNEEGKMAQQGNGSLAALNELRTPARNHYFYGKLLDVFHFQMEQTYFNRKRWLLNRLGLGSGVLCGLEVILADDGQHGILRQRIVDTARTACDRTLRARAA